MPPKVICILPKGGATEAPKDQIMNRILPEVPDENINGKKSVRTQDIVRIGLNLPTHPDHTQRPPVLVPGASVQKKVFRNTL